MAEEIDPQEAWGRAGRIAALYGSVPAQLTSVIRLLLADHREGRKDWSPTSLSAATRLFRGPSLCAALYYSSQSFRSEQLDSLERVGAEDLVKLYTPIDLVSIIAMVFMYRRARRVCPKDEFGGLSDEIVIHSEMGFHVGDAIPEIGAALGMLRASIRAFAFAALATQNIKLYKGYRRNLRTDDREFDAALETQEWGCTSAEISAVLLQTLGLGVPLPHSIDRSLAHPIGVLNENDLEEYRASLAALWVDSLVKTGDEPKIRHRGEFYPFQDAKGKLMQAASKLRTRSPDESWLMRGKADISAELTPALMDEMEGSGSDLEKEMDED